MRNDIGHRALHTSYHGINIDALAFFDAFRNHGQRKHQNTGAYQPNRGVPPVLIFDGYPLETVLLHQSVAERDAKILQLPGFGRLNPFVGKNRRKQTGCTVSDNGAGGASVLCKSFGFEINPELHAKELKDGAKFGAESGKGKITFTVDKADEIAYMTETPGAEGASFKGYGFGITVNVAGKKLGCTGMLDSEEQVAQAKAACNSLTKK